MAFLIGRLTGKVQFVMFFHKKLIFTEIHTTVDILNVFVHMLRVISPHGNI